MSVIGIRDYQFIYSLFCALSDYQHLMCLYIFVCLISFPRIFKWGLNKDKTLSACVCVILILITLIKNYDYRKRVREM